MILLMCLAANNIHMVIGEIVGGVLIAAGNV
jgi:hypothetical protein